MLQTVSALDHTVISSAAFLTAVDISVVSWAWTACCNPASGRDLQRTSAVRQPLGRSCRLWSAPSACEARDNSGSGCEMDSGYGCRPFGADDFHYTVDAIANHFDVVISSAAVSMVLTYSWKEMQHSVTRARSVSWWKVCMATARERRRNDRFSGS